MHAIRFDGLRTTLAQTEPPVADSGEAIIRPRWVALSPFDLSPQHGMPITLGHQFVGVVESLGPDADRETRRRWEGKRVVGSIDIVCSKCDLCRAGLAAHCRHRRMLGMRGWEGCLAERFKLPVRNLVEITASVDDQEAVFAHMLSGALHAAQLVRVEGKPYVTVLGDSAEALLCAQVMARLNASVRLLGERQFTLCEKWGIKHRHQGEVGRRQDQDIVVDCTADGDWGFALAMQLVRPRGRIVLRGNAALSGGLNLAPLIEDELQVLGARHGSIADAVAMLASGAIDTLPLITKRARLADGVAALRTAAEPDQITVIVEP